jgi:hypothetical protein
MSATLWNADPAIWDALEPEAAQDRPAPVPEAPRPAFEPVEPCGRRYSDTETGPLLRCALPAGHSGRHEAA